MNDEPRDIGGDDGAPSEPVTPEEKPVEASSETPAETPAEEVEEQGPSEEEAAAAAAAEAEAKAAAAKAKAEAAAKKKAEHEAAEALKDPWERDPKPPEWQEADDDPLAEALREKHGEAIESTRTFAGDLTIEVRRESLGDVCATLKEEQGYLLPVDACGAHYPDREEGQFEVVYHLYNFESNRRIRVKTRTEDGVDVPSTTPVWRGTNWPEREAYDMYGIRFEGHPDMSRILLWEGFNGFPLRKDFPIEGIDTGAAIYPEYYEDEAGPVAGTGTGWKPPEPPEPETEPEAEEGSEERGA